MAEFSKKKVSTEVPVYPLSEPVFERMNSLNPPSLRSLKTPVVWNEDIYALGCDCEGDGKLYKYSLSNNKWSSFSILSSIYASHSVLTTYNSKLLLISGKNMALWEFSNNDFAFKESCIKPIPSTYPSQCSHNILANSSDQYLVVAYETYPIPRYLVIIYNGRDWKLRELEIIGTSEVSGDIAAMDSHAVLMIESSRWCNNVSIQRVPIPSFDESKDEGMAATVLEMMSLEEFNVIIRGRKYSSIIHNQQFYCVDSQGIIFTTFLQPPLLPIVWGDSGISFDQAPHLVGLPDGALLMIGTIRHQDGSQLDVIKISQKDHEYNPDSHLTMKALVTLEWGMNVPVLTKLQSNFGNIMKLTDIRTKLLKRQIRKPKWTALWPQCITGAISCEAIEYIESWINSTDSVPEPTWRNFFRVLKEISPELDELVYQIKEIFHATEAAEDTAKLKAELIHLQSSSKSADEMARGLDTSVALCEDILQKIQKSDEEREQLEKQLQSKAKRLKLHEKAEDENKTRQLTNKDLPLLLRQLKLHAAKWREIGIHLGFLPGELDNIGARPNLSQGAPVSWFGAMLEEWLQWAPGDGRGSTSFATLEDLTDALNETGLGASACDLKLKVTSCLQLSL